MKITPTTTLVLVDQGDNAAGTTLAQRTNWAAALDHVLTHSFRAAHGGANRCRAAADGETLGPNDQPIQLKDKSDVPGAAGYHDDGNIYCFRDGASDDEFPIIISHEAFETIGDSGANIWADDGQGNEYARELCDAVEGFSFTPNIPPGQPGAGVKISDFLFPSFFDPTGQPPFSRLNTPIAPLSTVSDNGNDYQIVRKVDENGAQQVTASKRPARMAARRHPSSRAYRRGLRV